MKTKFWIIFSFLIMFPIVNSAAQDALNTIAFGSCSDYKKKQDIWEEISFHNPDLWIWLGDVIYANTESPALIKRAYQKQFNQDQYAAFREQTPVTGIWDDNDYGEGNGGKHYPVKEASAKHFLNFMEVPLDHEVWSYGGIYRSEVHGPPGKQVKLILLDVRYFRDDAIFDDRPNPKRKYLPNREGSMLGEKQWTWLEQELINNDAELTLICSGIEVLPDEHEYEKWANFPNEQTRLLNLIDANNSSAVVLLSGDRHISEISKTLLPSGDELFEITSSGMTHSYDVLEVEANRFRVGSFLNKKSFAVLKIDWKKEQASFTFQLIERRKGVFLEQVLH